MKSFYCYARSTKWAERVARRELSRNVESFYYFDREV